MTTGNQLAQSWENIFNGSKQAIDWIKQVRPNVARLNNEADGLILELRRLRNTAKRLGAVSTRPITTGFFGLSQAGKSYLISSLAAGTNGKLETEFDGKTLDFIKHINPPGGGSEATGLVTRFSRTVQRSSVSGYPLELRLFHEIEIAKILMNSYFNDFDKEKVVYELDQQKVSTLLKRLRSKKIATHVQGVTEDDVVDLQDYAHDSFGKSLSVLQGCYWAEATQLAPYLSIEDRAELFSILWGEEKDISAIYTQFGQTLTRLGHTDFVYAPLTAVVKEKDNGELSQADSIMDVNMVKRLNTPRDENILVRPATSYDDVHDPVEISLAELTALTAELAFPLINPTRVSAVEHVDLLDFPGYRGRLAITSVEDLKSTPDITADDNPMYQLILRGKVAYLFERYTDSQEMNLLIMCTPSDKQSEVNSVGPVLERWINKTQGENPQARSVRKPGLLWAMTMFDRRIENDLRKEEAMLETTWGKEKGLLKQTIIERFGNYEWFNNWSNDKPFNNVFLVRKPGYGDAFLEIENDKELSFNSKAEQQLVLLRTTFARDPDIQKHVADPEQAWDAMMLLNDGGMKRISDYLETVALPEVKDNRIAEQLNQAIEHVVKNRFDNWYQSDGDEEVQRKQELAKQVADALLPKALLVGELLRHLQLPEDTIRSLYLIDNETFVENESEQPVDNGFGVADFSGGFGGDFSSGFDLFGETSVVTTAVEESPTPKAPESRFAQIVFQAWIDHLRALSSDQRLVQFLQIPAQTIENIVGELITGANRLSLLDKLSKVVAANENTASKRDQLVERQVFCVNREIVDFIAWLGFMNVPLEQRPASRVCQGKTVFEPRTEGLDLNGHRLPRLSEQPENVTQIYLMDWFVAFGHFARNNAGHSAGREIDADQNATLGNIRKLFQESIVNI